MPVQLLITLEQSYSQFPELDAALHDCWGLGNGHNIHVHFRSVHGRVTLGLERPYVAATFMAVMFLFGNDAVLIVRGSQDAMSRLWT